MKLKNLTRSDHCLNCNTVLPPETNYCPNCGQLNNTKKETAFGLLKELVEDFLHLDNKVMGSLIPLVFRPGRLTKEYNEGRRARYLHPVRMFLSVTIIMLIITSISSDRTFVFSSKSVSEEDTTATRGRAGFSINFSDSTIDYNDLRSKIDSGIVDNDRLLKEFNIENTAYNRFVMSKAIKLGKMTWGEIIYYIKSKIPWILFALMPVFALAMHLVYMRKKIWFSDHLIYSFHLHSATFIIISLNSLLAWIFPILGSIILLYIPVYYFISLKNVYSQNWGLTLLKGIFGGLLYIAFSIFILAFAIGILFVLI